MTDFIQPCIGQAFCPLAPQSNVFGPAAALDAGAAEPAAGAAEPAAGAAEAVAVGSTGAAAALFSGGGAAALGAGAADATGAAEAAGCVSAAAALGFASGEAPSFFASPPPQPTAPASATIAAKRTPCLILLSLHGGEDRPFSAILAFLLARPKVRPRGASCPVIRL
ncbi:hypothetical protein E8A74_33305 [Polyangium fumosum]|uniref:Uncharacterized protein n=1 Tax=Polyangium fumosum TaxID=889272 RepID=A0A4U1J1A9_9BACT|nr:hypothetical protein E8A74_33305 [Polyangium fumosum]